uniref:Uncharacterized protein n=1 Tax=Oryza rufipogon TaxID=4529 RepID=A0A0E0RFW6_ORYRU
MAGIMKMPWIQLGVKVKGPVNHDIDTSELNTNFNWEIKHERRWIDMMKDSISAFGFCHSMLLCSGLQTNVIDAGSKSDIGTGTYLISTSVPPSWCRLGIRHIQHLCRVPNQHQ